MPTGSAVMGLYFMQDKAGNVTVLDRMSLPPLWQDLCLWGGKSGDFNIPCAILSC